jgi:hypothetical protein
MDSAGYLGHWRGDLGAFAKCLAGDLAAPVESCGDWTLYDLAAIWARAIGGLRSP